MKLLLSIILICQLGFIVHAHEGHEHDAPKMIKAPKGGSVKGFDGVNIEMLARGQDIKIYFYGEDMKPIPVQDFTLKAHAELPRSKKTEDIIFAANDTFFSASYKPKGVHRYTLHLAIQNSDNSKNAKLTFNIEPQK